MQDADRRLLETFVGQMNVDGTDCRMWSLGYSGYCHIGHDPAGEFLFASVDNGNDACGHHIAVIEPTGNGKAHLKRLTADLPAGTDQRWHAHPVLTPDRQAILYTSLGDDGFCHIYEVDVSDVTGGGSA